MAMPPTLAAIMMITIVVVFFADVAPLGLAAP